MTLKDKLEKIVDPICKAQNFFLVELKIKGDHRHPLFQIFVDSEKGITLGECEMLSRQIKDDMDIDDAFASNYRLDVSSPGLDRSLQHDFEFKKNIGQVLIVKKQTEGGTQTVTGKLNDFTEHSIQLETAEGELIIERVNIDQAKVKIQW